MLGRARPATPPALRELASETGGLEREASPRQGGGRCSAGPGGRRGLRRCPWYVLDPIGRNEQSRL